MPVPGATHFYRYQSATHLEWLEATIVRHQIYFPKPAELNDPAEGKPRLTSKSARESMRFFVGVWRSNHPDATLEEIAGHVGVVSSAIAKFGLDWMWRESTKLLHSKISDVKILSMSKRWNNMSLWAKYADNHRGYCLEYANTGILAAARAVEYVETTSVEIAADGSFDFDFFFRKKPDWSNEEEVRLFGPSFWPSINTIDPTWLTRIILGKDMLPAHREKITGWARQRQPPLAVAQAEYDDLEHVLAIQPVSG